MSSNVRGWSSSCLVLGAALLACGPGNDGSDDGGDGSPANPDAGPRDAGPRDAGPRDAGPTDGGDVDAGASDARALDASSPSQRKWNPGHYYALGGDTFNDTLWNAVLGELAATPNFQGFILRYDWLDLEGTEGQYDFSHINSRLASLGDKKLMIFLQMKTFSANERAVPTYMRNATYGGGDFQWVNGAGAVGGYAPRLMNGAVRARLNALMTAMAEEFDADPQVEAIIFPETALTENPSWTGTNEADYWAGLRVVDAHRAAVFENTISCQWVNYPRAKLATFVPDVRDNLGLALGGPDIVPQEPGLIFSTPPNVGAYLHMGVSGGLVPIIYNVSNPSYVSQTIDGTGDPQSIEEIYLYARDTLKSTHMTWTRMPAYRLELLQYLQTHTAPLNVSRPAHWL